MKMLYTVSANELWGLIGPENPSSAPGWQHRSYCETKLMPTGVRKFLERLGLLEQPTKRGTKNNFSHLSILARQINRSIDVPTTVVDWAFALQNIDNAKFPGYGLPGASVAPRPGKDADLLLRRLAYSSRRWDGGCGGGKVHCSVLQPDRALTAIWILNYLGYITWEASLNRFIVDSKGWFYLGYYHEQLQLEDLDGIKL